MRHTVLITGANGQVGQELKAIEDSFPAFNFLFTDRSLLDITDREATIRFFSENNPDYCINCAAYTAVDKAESDPGLARLINRGGAVHLAEACAERNAPLIHLSTDYVYHNQQNTPFKEDDPTSPKSVYAQTKLEGEKAALALHSLTMVVRTSWVYSEYGHNFVKTMLKLGEERPELRIVFDQIGTPTYAKDLANTLMLILQQVDNKSIPPETLSGIFHYSNEGVCSWYDFALAIFELRQIDCKVTPIESSDYPTPAARPPFSVLNKQKIKETFGLTIPHWRDGLIRCLDRL